jgi:outer membrane lipoprotein-sorting protein
MSNQTTPLKNHGAAGALRGKAALVLCLLLSAGLSQALAAAESNNAPPNLSAAQIIDKHIAARGGLVAWHAVQTLSVTGQLEAGSGDSAARSKKIAREGTGASVKGPGKPTPETAKAAEPQQVQLPFRLEMKRPHKSRLEVDFAGKTAVQVYDGQNGWKLRPFLNRNDAEPFTAQEAQSEADKADLEGPLVDYAAKGTKVALEGVDAVDGRSAYKLKLTLRNGDVQRIWIDAQSFLDVKIEGIPRRLDNKMRTVWIYQRDFRSVQGVMVPYAYETVVEGNPRSHRMLIESVAVNKPLDDARFTKPQMLLAGSPNPPAAAPSAVGAKVTGAK